MIFVLNYDTASETNSYFMLPLFSVMNYFRTLKQNVCHHQLYKKNKQL